MGVKRYLLDTGIAGAYIARRDPVFARARDEVRKGNVIGICVPVLGELHYGAEHSASRERALRELRAALTSLKIWPYANDAAEEYGRLAAELRRIGRPMQQIDIQIAAIAVVLGRCTVVTTDSDLSAVPGLHTENWTIASSPPA
ncbi:tRNA(fMet)-specific endonuclease VapC [Gemmata sp. SH-PL17]|nr:tRNA(fMet)-specific endonuclease VapC [Gemmata sp. SH-PL17]